MGGCMRLKLLVILQNFYFANWKKQIQKPRNTEDREYILREFTLVQFLQQCGVFNVAHDNVFSKPPESQQRIQMGW